MNERVPFVTTWAISLAPDGCLVSLLEHSSRGPHWYVNSMVLWIRRKGHVDSGISDLWVYGWLPPSFHMGVEEGSSASSVGDTCGE